MKQFDSPINKLLNDIVEQQRPSVSFESVWSSYSKDKRHLTYNKKATVLVATILLLVLSSGYVYYKTSWTNNKNVAKMVIQDAASSASMVFWNNAQYYKSGIIVPASELDEKLGEITKQTFNPKKNGESNECPIGTKLYSIKNKDSNTIIAVEFQNKYYESSTMNVINKK